MRVLLPPYLNPSLSSMKQRERIEARRKVYQKTHNRMKRGGMEELFIGGRIESFVFPSLVANHGRGRGIDAESEVIIGGHTAGAADEARARVLCRENVLTSSRKV